MARHQIGYAPFVLPTYKPYKKDKPILKKAKT